MGRKVPYWCSVRLQGRLLLPFSDSLSTVDFSHLETKGVGYARHQSRLKEVIEMRTLPPKMLQVLASFAPLFSKRVWQHAQLLLVGAILAPGRRTVPWSSWGRSAWSLSAFSSTSRRWHQRCSTTTRPRFRIRLCCKSRL